MPIIDVGTPPASLLTNELETQEIRFHEFEGLPAEKGSSVTYSPEFTCFGHKWRLKIYPGGDSASEEGMVGVYLDQFAKDEKIIIMFGISLKTIYGKMVKREININVPEFHNCWGWHDFWQRSKVVEALVDGTLIIEVRMRKSGVTHSPYFLPQNPFAKKMKTLFMNEESADVLFKVGEEESFHAHHLIIQNCSSVLGELCKPGEDAVTTVSITDVEPDIFKHMLYYIYGGEVSKKDMEDNAALLIDATDKYGVVNLKLQVEVHYVEEIELSSDNLIDNLLYADSKNLALLKETVMDFLLENYDDIIGKVSFEDVPGTMMTDLLTAVARNGKKNDRSSDNVNYNTIRVGTLRKMLDEKKLDVDGSREAMIATLKREDEEGEDEAE